MKISLSHSIPVTVLVLVFSQFGSSTLFAADKTASGRDLNSSLAELTRLAPATDQDLSLLHLEQGRLHWLTFWRHDTDHKAETAEALRRNLQLAVPNLVKDTQNSNGSLSATFKLYNDLSVACESLDSLLVPKVHASKPELISLSNDLSDMNRIRQEIADHIQRTAAQLEAPKTPDVASAAAVHPKKIIVDDAVPDKPSARKRP